MEASAHRAFALVLATNWLFGIVGCSICSYLHMGHPHPFATILCFVAEGSACSHVLPEHSLLFSGIRRFWEIVIEPGQIFQTMTWGRGTKKCPPFMNPRTSIQNVYNMYYVHMYLCIYICTYIWKVSFAFDLGRIFDSISLKLGWQVLDQIDPIRGALEIIFWFSIHLFGNTVKLTHIQTSSSFIEFATSWKPFLLNELLIEIKR